MIKLTDYEQKMLNGEMGELKQVALQNVIKYAEVVGAEELVEIKKATLMYGAHDYLKTAKTDDYEEIFSKMYMCSDKKLKIEPFCEECYCQSCMSTGDYFLYDELYQDKELFDKTKEYLDIMCEAGVAITNSCTPYLTGWIPLRGEGFVTTESSNVLMCNSVFGAHGNAGGIESATWCAICGRAPKWGNHVLESRYGTYVFDIQCEVENGLQWDVLGNAVGRNLPEGEIPILVGNFPAPNLNMLKKFFSALAMSSGAEMCHIVGITPEARSVEDALGKREAKKTITITQDFFNQCSYELNCHTPGSVQLVSIGCPHYSLEEVQYVAKRIGKQKLAKDVDLFVWTDITTKAACDASGYTKTIEDAGGCLVTSSCVAAMGPALYDRYEGMAFDAVKQWISVSADENTERVYYGDIDQCIEAALTGYWKAE